MALHTEGYACDTYRAKSAATCPSRTTETDRPSYAYPMTQRLDACLDTHSTPVIGIFRIGIGLLFTENRR